MFKTIVSEDEIVVGANIRMTVRATHTAYSDCTITKIEGSLCTALRPYVYNGKAGFEEVSFFKSSCVGHDEIIVR